MFEHTILCMLGGWMFRGWGGLPAGLGWYTAVAAYHLEWTSGSRYLRSWARYSSPLFLKIVGSTVRPLAAIQRPSQTLDHSSLSASRLNSPTRGDADGAGWKQLLVKALPFTTHLDPVGVPIAVVVKLPTTGSWVCK
jgi:hypothetical protein